MSIFVRKKFPKFLSYAPHPNYSVSVPASRSIASCVKYLCLPERPLFGVLHQGPRRLLCVRSSSAGKDAASLSVLRLISLLSLSGLLL